MSKCKVSCFERTLHAVKPTSEYIWELYRIITEEDIMSVLDFGIKMNCFTERQAMTLLDGIRYWDDVKGDSCENDTEKYNTLLTKMGVNFDALKAWQFKYNKRNQQIANSRLIVLQDGTSMGDYIYVFRTDAPASRLKKLLDECNKIYINGGCEEDIPYWSEVIESEGYLFDYIDETCVSSSYAGNFDDIKERYVIDNQPYLKAT